MDGTIAGWCSLSPYRPGRMALRFTAEISSYVDQACHCQGVATALTNHAMAECPKLQIKTLFGILLERNIASRRMMEKWGSSSGDFFPGWQILMVKNADIFTMEKEWVFSER